MQFFLITLVKPILCHGCEIWAIVGNRTDLDNLERIQQGLLKRLLEVQTRTTNLHVLAEFGRFPLQLSWQALTGKYMDRLESMDADRLIKQAFDADCRLPATQGDPATKISFTTTTCHRQLRTCPTVGNFPFHQHNSSIFSS